MCLSTRFSTREGFVSPWARLVSSLQVSDSALALVVFASDVRSSASLVFNVAVGVFSLGLGAFSFAFATV